MPPMKKIYENILREHRAGSWGMGPGLNISLTEVAMLPEDWERGGRGRYMVQIVCYNGFSTL